MDCEISRSVLSLIVSPAGLPSGPTPNQSSPAPCLLRIAEMEIKPSLREARLFLSSMVSPSLKLIPDPHQVLPNGLLHLRPFVELLGGGKDIESMLYFLPYHNL
jgi:hypothetical protein